MRRLLLIVPIMGLLAGTGLLVRPQPARSSVALDLPLAAPAGVDYRTFRATPLPPAPRPHILLITIDTLRAEHLSAYGYSRTTTPHLDAFAAGARVFTRAYATAPLTTPSMVSMHTGLYPYRHGVRVLWQRVRDEVLTLPDHLHRAGYRSGAVVSNLVLSGDATALGERFDHYDDAVDEPEPNRPEMFERRASRTTDAALAWLDEVKSDKGPVFLWVHYIDPHGPYAPPDDKPADFTHDTPAELPLERIADYARLDGVTDAAEYIDRYDEEIAYTDREIGRLLQGFAERGFDREAITIVTSDHGERLHETQGLCFCHGFDVEESTLRVPLMVRHASLSPQYIATPVSIADVFPTVLELAHVPTPPDLDGRSLCGKIAMRPPYAEGRDSSGSGGLHRALIYPDRKVVVQHGRSNIPRRSWAVELTAAGVGSNAGMPSSLVGLTPATATFPVDPADPAYVVLSALIRSDKDPGGLPASAAGKNSAGPLVADHLDNDSLRKLRSLGYVH